MTKDEWLAKFPWMDGFVNEWYEYIGIDECPMGWTDSIELMCEELNEVIKRDQLVDFAPLQIKEKYGDLRFYVSGGNAETDRIIDDYSVLLGNVCFSCGRPDSAFSKARWIECTCKECYYKHNNGNYDEEYDVENARMVDTREVIVFGAPRKKIYDLRPTAEKIRKKWEEKHNV